MTASKGNSPFQASASAIMLAMVLRQVTGSAPGSSRNSTDIPAAAPFHRASSARTTSLPEHHGGSEPVNATRRAGAGVSQTRPVAQPNPSAVEPTPTPSAP